MNNKGNNNKKFRKNSCTCSSAAKSTVLFQVKDINFKAIRAKAWMRRCCRCGSYFPGYIPNESSFYKAYKNYYTFKKKKKRKGGLLTRLINPSRKNYLKRSTPKNSAKILDYGCGSGEFLRYIVANGYKGKLYASDIHRPVDSIDELAEWIELRDLKKHEGSFSWITINHVVEHISYPGNTLSILRMCLSENGAIWISTPNSNSFLFEIFREYARDVDFPRHLHVMSMKALKELLENSGYKRIEFLSPPRINALINMLHSLKLYVTCSGNHGYKKMAFILRAAGRMIVHLCLHKVKRDLESPEIIIVAR